MKLKHIYDELNDLKVLHESHNKENVESRKHFEMKICYLKNIIHKLENELLPCPFCGSNDLSVDERTVSTERNRTIISCDDCPCEMEDNLATINELMDKWNKRYD